MNTSLDHWDYPESQEFPYVAQLLVKKENLIPSRDGYFVTNTDHTKRFPLLCPDGAQVHVVENLSYAFGGVMTVTIGGDTMLMKRQLGDDGMLQHCFLQDSSGNYVERVFRSSSAFGWVVYAEVYMANFWIIGSSDDKKPIEYLCDRSGNIVREFKQLENQTTGKTTMKVLINEKWRDAQTTLDHQNRVQLIGDSQLAVCNEEDKPDVMRVNSLKGKVQEKTDNLLAVREDTSR